MWMKVHIYIGVQRVSSGIVPYDIRVYIIIISILYDIRYYLSWCCKNSIPSPLATA